MVILNREASKEMEDRMNAMLFRVGNSHANRCSPQHIKSAIRATARKGQLNKIAQSNQQDLIDEIEMSQRQRAAWRRGISSEEDV
jgi:hypothetical protein